MTDLVLDIGNSHLKGALFKEKEMTRHFVVPSSPLEREAFCEFLKKESPSSVMISSVNPEALEVASAVLKQEKIPFYVLGDQKIKLVLDVDEKEQLGQDRIANSYGALCHFPINDCIVVDVGTAVTFDMVSKDGKYHGGAIYPGFSISAKALSDYTKLLPNVSIDKPPSPVAKTTKTHIQSGIYYGLLGAIERVCDEIRQCQESPSSIRILATGGITQPDAPYYNKAFVDDLNELVDRIDPYLTLVGLHEILKELESKKE